MARTDRKRIRISDEGIILVEDADSIDFTGLGVTGSVLGKDVTEVIPSGGVTAHSALTGLTTGDDHTQYAFLGGRAGGQTLIGGTLTTQNLTLRGNAADLTTGAVLITTSTQSTTAATGSLILSGGLGVAKRINVTGSITGAGDFLGLTNQVSNLGTAAIRMGNVNAKAAKFYNNSMSSGTPTLNGGTYDEYFLTALGDVGTGTMVFNVDSTNLLTFTVGSLYQDTLGSGNNSTEITNNVNGGFCFANASVFQGQAFSGNTAKIQNTGGGSVTIGAAYAHYGDSSTSSTSTLTSSGFASFAGGAVGSSNYNSIGNGCTAILQNSSAGGFTYGNVAIPVDSTGFSATLEGTGTGAATAFGNVTRGVASAYNRGSFVLGAIDATTNTAGAYSGGLASFVVARVAGAASVTSTGNASAVIGNTTLASTGAILASGAATLIVAQTTSSGTITVSSVGSIFVGRANSTGSVSITTGAGNFGFGDAGATGISATGALNCGQIGQGTNTTASSVQFGVGVLLSELTTVPSVFSNQLNLAVGTTTVVPLNIPSGTLKTTPVSGDIEHNTDDFFATIATGPARKAFILDDGTRLTSGAIPVATTNGRLINSAFTSTNLTFGTYTPTLTNTTNIDASTARLCTWMRVGNTVTVAGQFDIDPTTTLTATLLGMSLPVASALTTAFQLGGTAIATGVASMSAGIEADATNDRASVKFIATDVTNQTMAFTFSYQVL